MSDFFQSVVDWQLAHGRHGLPWQGSRDPYRVWLSEIMLQQTQVSTVLAYYPRFLDRFPTLHALAAAPESAVMTLWSGLGYYSRARHLHRCAQVVVAEWDGQFPRTAAELQQLPGIGPSTAAAIAAFCFGERVSIMDGNVQRVLSRWLAFDQDLAQASSVKTLWALAQALIPPTATHPQMIAYTQGLMDLGATLCRSTKPHCLTCPLQPSCQAFEQDRTAALPVKRRTLKRRTEAWWFLVLRRPDGHLWLEPRPSTGIWAGLYTFPLLDGAEQARKPPHGVESLAPVWHEPIAHDLTHRALQLHLVEWAVTHDHDRAGGCWVDPRGDMDLGLPAPLRSWIRQRAQGL